MFVIIIIVAVIAGAPCAWLWSQATVNFLKDETDYPGRMLLFCILLCATAGLLLTFPVLFFLAEFSVGVSVLGVCLSYVFTLLWSHHFNEGGFWI